MTAFFWTAAAILLVLVVALFLWGRAERNRRFVPRQDRLGHDEEFAQEIAPVQPYTEPVPFRYELPNQYGQDRLTLLVRDPGWLYAYWEVSATRLEEVSRDMGSLKWRQSRPVLRLYDVTDCDFNGDNAPSFVDLPVNDDADNWHIQVNHPNRSFCVDLGRLTLAGEFFPILRSNIVTTPRASFSDVVDEEWMWIEGIYGLSHGPETGVSSILLAGQPVEVPGGISSSFMFEKGES